MLRWMLPLALLVLSLSPAAAESPLIVAQRFSLLGTWSANCDVPRSPSNWYTVWLTGSEGELRRRFDGGADDQRYDHAIEGAHAVAPRKLRIFARNDHANWGPQNGQRTDETMEFTDQGMRVVESKLVDTGEILIRNGMFTSENRAVPFSRRCQ